jgi:outer membrane lipoprotein SlyB
MKKFIKVLSLIILLFAFTVSIASAQRHHKWSHRKKDAVIGAGGGAVVGGLIGHGAKGAVIGGVVGGTAGYLHGRHKDKKVGNLRK